MKSVIERLWSEYFAEECAVADSDEERATTRRALEMHDRALKTLTEDAFQEYIDVLLELQSYQIKKAFFKGCEFAVSFFLETRI